MPATAAWLASTEALLNRNIADSARAAALAQRLQGADLQLDIEGLGSIRATVIGGRLALLAAQDFPPAAAHAAISGSPRALLQLLQGGGAKRDPALAAAQIRGDAEIAQLYRELFVLARPDAEEELSRILGDLPARKIMQLAGGVLAWVRGAGRTAGENIAEYLQEESRDVVAKPELDEFLRGVDEAREAADRIEARLAGLEKRLRSS